MAWNNITSNLLTKLDNSNNLSENNLFFKTLIDSLKNEQSIDVDVKTNSNLDDMFRLLTDKQPVLISNYQRFMPNYIQMLNDFRLYIDQNFEDFSTIHSELISAIYKLFGWCIGTIMGNYILYCKSKNFTEPISKIEKSLIGDV